MDLYNYEQKQVTERNMVRYNIYDPSKQKIS